MIDGTTKTMAGRIALPADAGPTGVAVNPGGVLADGPKGCGGVSVLFSAA